PKPVAPTRKKTQASVQSEMRGWEGLTISALGAVGLSVRSSAWGSIVSSYGRRSVEAGGVASQHRDAEEHQGDESRGAEHGPRHTPVHRQGADHHDTRVLHPLPGEGIDAH